MSLPTHPAPSAENPVKGLDDRFVLELILKNQRFPCRDGDVIGREGTVAATALAQAKTLSRQHLLVSAWREATADGHLPEGWFIQLTPTARNETLLDGRAMPHDLWHALSPGEHHLFVVDFEFSLFVSDQYADRTESGIHETVAEHSVIGLEQLRQKFGLDGLFHLIADNTRDLVAIIDDQGKRVWNNAAYLNCLGYRPEDIRHSYSMTEIHPDDLPVVKQAFDDSMRTGVGKRIEYRMRHRDQRWVYLESQASVVNIGDGAEKYLVLVARDITTRKDAEQKALQRVRHLIERGAALAKLTQAAGLKEGDVDGCITQVVETAAEHFDCERASVWLFSPDGETLVCEDLFERTPHEHSRGQTWPAAACGQFLAALHGKRCLAIDSAFTDERLNELRPIYLFSHRVSSMLNARICLGNEVLGILVVERTDVIEHWSLEDQNFAASLADVLLAALQARKRVDAFEAMQRSQHLLDAEIAEANKYVRALLPEPLTGEVESEWCFVPCTSVAGDGLGYQWLDEDHLAIYLLDAAGHGVGASLLCTSALNTLRSAALPEVDFRDPGAVLGGLNHTFDMEKQDNMFFTIWYGVYDRRKREIAYAAAGHPPPVLIDPDAGPGKPPRVLQESKGMMIGADADAVFIAATVPVPPHARLYVFSDGAFEIVQPDGTLWGFDQLVELLGTPPPAGVSELENVRRHLQEMHGSPELPDDFSILRLVFH